MVLYEVHAPGYHSPLTKTQIAELFRAGRVGRNHRCKQITHKEWRTIDELFPLLKYHSATISCYEPWQPVLRSPIDRTVVLACIAVALAIAALWFYMAHDSNPTNSTYRVPVSGTRRTTTSTRGTRVPTVAAQRLPPPQQQWQTNGVAANSIVIMPELPVVANTRPVDRAAQQREAQERQRQQAELARLQQERAKQEEKARGQDVIFPLDQEMIIYVGGMPLRLKIHDNDVTSFDVWINGGWRREVPKQKGITHSRTDETFIFDSGRARLYYVWEPSGKLNHCLLRVREN